MRQSSKWFIGGLVALVAGLYLVSTTLYFNHMVRAINHEGLVALKLTVGLLAVPGALLTLLGFILLVGAVHFRIVENKGERHVTNELLGMYFTSCMIGFTGGLISICVGLWTPHAVTLGYLGEADMTKLALCSLGIGLMTLGSLFWRKHAKLVRS